MLGARCPCLTVIADTGFPAQSADCRSLVGACVGALYLAAEQMSSIFSHLAGQCGGYTDTVRRRSLAFEIVPLVCPLDLNEPRP